MSQQLDTLYFPLQHLLPELQQQVLNFLDPKSLLSILVCDQHFYFQVARNEAFKAFRLMAMIQLGPVMFRGNAIKLRSDMPTDISLVRSAIQFFLNKSKWINGVDFNTWRARAFAFDDETSRSNMCEHETLKKQVDDCLCELIRHVKLFDLKEMELTDEELKTIPYAFLRNEYMHWRIAIHTFRNAMTTTLKGYEKEAFNRVKHEIYEHLDQCASFPHGLKEMDTIVPVLRYATDNSSDLYTKLRQFMWRDRKEHLELHELLNTVVEHDKMIYFLLRLGLLPYSNIPLIYQTNREVILFAIQYHVEDNAAFKMKGFYRPNKKTVFSGVVKLVPELANDKEIIKTALLSKKDELIHSVYQTCMYGKIENDPLGEEDYRFLGSIVKQYPKLLDILVNYNRESAQKYSWTETDVMKILNYCPNAYSELSTEKIEITDKNWRSFKHHPKLAFHAVTLMGENLTSVAFDKTFKDSTELEHVRELCVTAVKHLQHPVTVSQVFFSKIPEALTKDVAFLKEIIPICPKLGYFIDDTFLEKDWDLIMFLAPIVSVVDILFKLGYSCSTRSQAWALQTFSDKRVHKKPDFLLDNREFALATLKSFPLQYNRFPSYIQEDPEVFNIIMESGCDISTLPVFYKKVKGNKQLAEKAIRFGANIFLFDECIHNDRELFKIAIAIDPRFLNMSSIFTGDKEMVMYTIETCNKWRNIPPNFMTFSSLDEKLLQDREVVKKAILETATFVDVQNLPKEFQNDKLLMKATLLKNGQAYPQLPDELKNDLEIAEAAVRSSCKNYNHLPQVLRDRREFFLLAVSRGLTQVSLPFQMKPQQDDDVKWEIYSEEPSEIFVRLV
ncbi:hypothetical protein C9374_005325 [Naegleria lovaniensis]|uniref:DUF4116 domain-containing protein n=1 Tax=Naegleria lovaniensis TaxID=51637 RepID=A0AA88KKM3_NAELO|nr:uncharacterized protein C9374_005325 [Naegleria lovaniensis]KAG2382745.1 hypothetical protein C9374_005325 [Naegleria lovaniensis]